MVVIVAFSETQDMIFVFNVLRSDFYLSLEPYAQNLGAQRAPDASAPVGVLP